MARRGENIYKRKDGRWEGRYIKSRDATGKAIYGYIYSKTYNETKEKLSTAKTNYTNNGEKNSESEKLSILANQWLNTALHHCKQSTYVKYRNIIFNHIIPELGNYTLDEIDTKTISAFCQNKLLIYGLSSKSVRDILSIIRLIIKYANNLGIVCNCDFGSIPIKPGKNTVGGMTNTQTRNLTGFLMNNIDHVNVGILIAMYTGIRIGELCALKYQDILLENKTIIIDKTMQRIQNFKGCKNKTDIIISSPKSDCSIREIPIPQFIIDIILENNLYQKDAYILTGQKDKFIEPRSMENKFNKVASVCGIRNITFHMIRHTFASTCIEAGVDIKTLSEILGHSSVNITLNRYVHSSMENKKLNMEKLYAYSFLSPSTI